MTTMGSLSVLQEETSTVMKGNQLMGSIVWQPEGIYTNTQRSFEERIILVGWISNISRPFYKTPGR